MCHLKIHALDADNCLTCAACAAVVHRNCYSPLFEEKGKQRFKCDECKHQPKNKDSRLLCSVCGRDRQHGLLKHVGADEWMHVLCAFGSPRTRLAAYRTLIFHADGAPSAKRLAKNVRCGTCEHDRTAGLPCRIPDCRALAHLNCVALPREEEEGYSAFLTIGLLDKHEDSLIQQLRGREGLELRGLELYSREVAPSRYFVCAEHNRDEFFLWCYCGGEGMVGSELIECERCSRWFHKECSISAQFCNGCVSNNIYEKNVPLHQLVGRAIEIEQASLLDKTHVKFLDHFALKLSEELLKQLAKGAYEVEKYYLRKALGETELGDTGQLATAVEIIYYLEKKERKGKDEISPRELEEIIQSFSRGNKFEWSKTERIERRFKTSLEELLKAVRRDGTRELKGRLQDFIRANQASVRSHEQIAGDLVELVRAL